MRGTTHESVTLFPAELLAEKRDHGLESIRGGDFEEVLAHDGGAAGRLESNHDCRESARCSATRERCITLGEVSLRRRGHRGSVAQSRGAKFEIRSLRFPNFAFVGGESLRGTGGR